MGTWKLPPPFASWIDQLSQPLHGRLAWRLLPVLAGFLFAQGRRTFASYLRAISLAKRAAHQLGWQQAAMTLYSGKTVTKTFKSFLATYPPVGGLIRVVLTREESGWVAFFCTDASATAETILKAVADRSVIEQDFHAIKEVHGAGQQQVRHLWANVAV